MPPPARVKSNEFNFQNAVSSPLGRITMVGFGVRQTVAVGTPRILGQFALVYIVDGRGKYDDANGRRKDIAAGDVMILFPGLAHRYNPLPGTHWVTTYLCFQGPIFDLWLEQGVLNPAKPLHHAEPVAHWNRRLEAVCDEARLPGSSPPLLGVCLLQQLLAEILSGMGRSMTYQDDLQWVTRATGIIEANLIGAVDWETIAHQMGLTSESFRKRFTRLVGQTPSRYRMGRTIDRACAWMQHRQLKDRQIADELGFCDEFHFSRRFKSITGQSPREFRQSRLPQKPSS